MIMMTMTGSTRQRDRAVRRTPLDSVGEPRARNAEHDIAAYLHRHQNQLAPEIRMALERRMGRGHWR
jgi:hypothetical protein